MRKTIVLAALVTMVFACNSSGDQPNAEEKTADSAATTPPVATTGQYDKGLEMIGALDCTTCHKISEKNIGPAYTDVALKYEATDANIDSLSHKIIHGGQGIWGQIPMTPHPTLSLDSAREMVKYILSLRK